MPSTRKIAKASPKRPAESSAPSVAIAIMAAGKGTRLKSKHPKVLHEVGGKPLLAHVIASARKVAAAEDIYAIIGHEADLVQRTLGDTGIRFVRQEPQRGTGHALMCAAKALANYETVIVLSGDAPLISSATIEKLRDFHDRNGPPLPSLSARIEKPAGWGRVSRPGQTVTTLRASLGEKLCSTSRRQSREA